MPYVHSWAEDGSTLLYFGTVAPAPPAGRSRDHRTAGPGPRGSPPQWRRAGRALRSPVWGNLERPGRVFSFGDRATVRHTNWKNILQNTVHIHFRNVFRTSSFKVVYGFVKHLLPAQKTLLWFTLTRPTTPLRKSGQASTFPLWVTWEDGQLLARTLIYSIEESKISWYNIKKIIFTFT